MVLVACAVAWVLMGAFTAGLCGASGSTQITAIVTLWPLVYVLVCLEYVRDFGRWMAK